MRKELEIKILDTLCDPKSPWYGSDLVGWVDDYIREVNKQHSSRQVENFVSQHRAFLVDLRKKVNDGNNLDIWDQLDGLDVVGIAVAMVDMAIKKLDELAG